MIKPDELNTVGPFGPWSCRASDVWDALVAAEAGDVDALRDLLARDPNLYRAEYWYTQPIHLAVREGRVGAVELLLDAGADPAATSLSGEDLSTIARERGHEQVATMLAEARDRQERTAPSDVGSDHPLHDAAARDDIDTVRTLLDAQPDLVNASDHLGGTPLHRAVAGSAARVVDLLLDSGADINAYHGSAAGPGAGYAAVDFQAIDLALWNGPFWARREDLRLAQRLVEGGAERDVVISAALGDLDRVIELLDQEPARIEAARPNGKRALSSAVEFGHGPVVRLLLARGADPNWPEGPSAPRGIALHAAARAGDAELVELLLAHGADPNGYIDSSGSATFAAKTPELRATLMSHGGHLDTYDLVWLGDDEEVVRRVTADPAAANEGCGGVFAAACKLGKRDLLQRVLAAGARVPATVTACRSYLWHEPETLAMLLESGMAPDLPNWQRATPLHDLCARDGRGRPRRHRTECARLFLDAGAPISARDDDYKSTPLAWAARSGLTDMVEFLLARGAPTNLPDDEPWATPLAWARKRGHGRVEEILRTAEAAG